MTSVVASADDDSGIETRNLLRSLVLQASFTNLNERRFVDSNDVTAELTITQQLLGGIAPAGPMITIKISPSGFFHSGGLGGLGQALEPLSAEHVAAMLRQSFNDDELRALLDHVVLLRNAL